MNPISWHALTSIRFWCFVFVMRQETPTEAFDTPGIYRTQQDHRIQDPEPNQPLPRLEIRPDDVCICNLTAAQRCRPDDVCICNPTAAQHCRSDDVCNCNPTAAQSCRSDDVCICNPTAWKTAIGHTGRSPPAATRGGSRKLRNEGIVA